MVDYINIPPELLAVGAELPEFMATISEIRNRMGVAQIATPKFLSQNAIQFKAFKYQGQVTTTTGWSSAQNADYTIESFQAVVKTFNWKLRVTDQDMADFERGNPIIRQGVMGMIRTNNNLLAKSLDSFLINGPSGEYADALVIPPLSNSNVGTSQDPSDVNDTPGTNTNWSAVNLTGSAVSTLPINSTWLRDAIDLGAEENATTGERLVEPGDQMDLLINDNCAKYVLPANSQYLGAAGQWKSTSMAQDLSAAGINVIGTKSITWTGADDATMQYYMLGGANRNFLVAEIEPLEVQPWQHLDGFWKLEAHMMLAAFARPIWDGSSWQKALRTGYLTPIGV